MLIRIGTTPGVLQMLVCAFSFYYHAGSAVNVWNVGFQTHSVPFALCS